MDRALQNYSLAFAKALVVLELERGAIVAQAIREVRRRGKIETILDKNKAASLISKKCGFLKREFAFHSSLWDGLWWDLAATLASWFELQQNAKNISFPTVERIICSDVRERLRLAALDGFVRITTEEEERALKDELNRAERSLPVPLFFNRPDGAVRRRSFSLLVKDGRYYALLYLLHDSSGRKTPLKGGSRAVMKTFPVFTPSPRPAGAVIVPLECGRWHEEVFLGAALEAPEMVRAARLSRGPDGYYYVHVMFEFDAPAPREPKAVLTVDRGLNALAAMAVLDFDGRVQPEFDSS